MKLGARSAVFWNGINKDIDHTASHCTECQEAQPRQTREELEPTDIPPYAWHTVGADLVFLDNANFLIVADYHSKYPFVYKLPSRKSTTISRCLNSLFAEQGVPVINSQQSAILQQRFPKICRRIRIQTRYIFHLTTRGAMGSSRAKWKSSRSLSPRQRNRVSTLLLPFFVFAPRRSTGSWSHQRNYYSDDSFRTTSHVVARETPVKQTISNISLRSRNNRRPTMTSVLALRHWVLCRRMSAPTGVLGWSPPSPLQTNDYSFPGSTSAKRERPHWRPQRTAQERFRRSTMHTLTCSSIDRRRRRFLLVHSSLSDILRQLNASEINVFWIRSISMPTTGGARPVHRAWKSQESLLAWRRKPQETSDRPWRRKASVNRNAYDAYASWRDVKLRTVTKTKWRNWHEPP